MLNDTLVLPVDLVNTGTTTDKTYSRFDEVSGRSTYIATNHSPASRDLVQFSRSLPKRAGNFKGVSKSSVKFTRDVNVPGFDSTTTISAPIIIEVSFSVPVGVDASSVLEARQTAIAALDMDTVMDALNIQGMV